MGRDRAPTEGAIRKLVRKVREKGMLVDDRSGPRARTVRTPENIEAVAQSCSLADLIPAHWLWQRDYSVIATCRVADGAHRRGGHARDYTACVRECNSSIIKEVLYQGRVYFIYITRCQYRHGQATRQETQISDKKEIALHIAQRGHQGPLTNIVFIHALPNYFGQLEYVCHVKQYATLNNMRAGEMK
ncbi:hypothetical protein G5I_05242 [Acromyrmex echinatior]|uniref:DUF4817 domain-containing protein n=1 Tax=Acromyrmex echinatior TaxID=103372 RepID=F4WHS2_ACREC|nr:hypothetical protein G5I_05242 [Acromyrmex echinatior]